MISFRRFTAFSLILLLVLALVSPVLADASEEELQDIQRQMRQQQSRRNDAQRQVDNLSDRLGLIQADLDAAQSDYKAIQAKRAATEQQIKLNTEILAKTERNLAERTQILNKRMRDIYENGQISYLDVLLGSADFRDFATRVDILRRVLDQDAALIAQVRAERELVIQKREELERDKAAILTLEQEAAAKKEIIEARKQEQQAVLDTAVNERDAAEQAYRELQETSRRIERMLQSIQSGNREAAGASGAMMWPVQGVITSPFGWRTHPIFGTSIFHSGLDIGVDYGEPVKAADGGIVVEAGWMGGYGKAVIIDHGGGISTLYGHNSELLVGAGQRIGKGQVIALAGSTGYSTGPHVHFEVRKNGEPVNPYNYLP
ncbi:MAG TPA: peptidoglycan DD-metalloendopeptidase family protein [Selenomonadales bacterium]|nr:peptidoglycan DD-metalloendopeptidase family protein [Selenomonadales bacterium]